jgi:hypothetical protein
MIPDLSPPPDTHTSSRETAWPDPASPHHLLRLEVVTNSHRIIGVAQHPTLVRPVDLLNWTEDALALADVEITPLEGQTEAPRRWPQAHIRKQAIALVIPQEVAPPTPAASKLEYVEKRRWRVSVLLPRLIVTGHFHLPSAADPANSSLFWNARFVPLTEAEAVYLPDPTTTWKAAVIIVNAAHAEVYCPAAPLLNE